MHTYTAFALLLQPLSALPIFKPHVLFPYSPRHVSPCRAFLVPPRLLSTNPLLHLPFGH